MRKIIKLKNQNEEISQYEEGQEKNFKMNKKPRDIRDKIRISSSQKQEPQKKKGKERIFKKTKTKKPILKGHKFTKKREKETHTQRHYRETSECQIQRENVNISRV